MLRLRLRRLLRGRGAPSLRLDPRAGGGPGGAIQAVARALDLALADTPDRAVTMRRGILWGSLEPTVRSACLGLPFAVGWVATMPSMLAADEPGTVLQVLFGGPAGARGFKVASAGAAARAGLSDKPPAVPFVGGAHDGWRVEADPATQRGLLVPPVQEALLMLAGGGAEVWLDQDGIRVRWEQGPDDPLLLLQGVAAAVTVAGRCLRLARGGLGT